MTRQIPVRTALAAAIFAALPVTALAEPAEDKQPIDTVTIIGRAIDVNDVPGSAHVVDSEALAEFAQSDILRVLRTVPGVYIQEEEGWGLRPNIGIRGSGLDRSARIALLEDGVLIAPAPYASPSAYYFPTMRRMNAIEVLKGPSSINVGPRTTGGAINMISTPIPTGQFGANADLRFGDFNTMDAHVNAGGSSENFGWMLETVQATSDGFKNIQGPVGGDTGYDIEDYVAKFEVKTDASAEIYQSLRVKAGYTDQTSNETYLGLTDADFAATPYDRYAASANDIFNSEHEQLQATYVIDPGNSWRGEVTAYRNNFNRNWYKLQSAGGESLGDILDDPTTYATELGYLRGETSPDDALQVRANNREYYSQGIQGKVEWDLGFRDTEVNLDLGFRVHEDEEDRFQWQDGYRMEDGRLVLTSNGAPGSQTNRVSTADVNAFFIATDIRAGRWIFTPGVRYEDITLTRLDYSTSDPNRADGPTRVRENSVSAFIPGAGALYKLSDEWRLLAGVHRGFNPPGPGSDADIEESTNWEAGVRYDTTAFGFEAIAFFNDYDNLVGTVTESTGGGGAIGDQFDGGAVEVSGLELMASTAPRIGGIDVPLSIRYTWTSEAEFKEGFESDYDPWGDVVAGDELPYIPEHQFRAQAGLEATKWHVNIAANYIGEMRTLAGQGAFIPEESLDDYFVWDLMGAWRFTDQLSAYVKVDNLLDETYATARRPAGVRPGLPRTAYLGLTFRL
ncbi:MAG: TonB-dependent receptor [Woeseiaceae bacterium]|jgi:Fe(3+) dicitrate transport protein|nr:TonB-dependent receptor [Woeseiaceae bacterium]